MTQPNELRRNLNRDVAEKVFGWRLFNYETGKYAKTEKDYSDAANNDGWTWDGRARSEEAWQFQPTTENSPHALEVLKWCAEKADSRGRHLVVNVNRLADKKVWDVSEYDADGALYETGCGPTLEQATCLLALALSKEGV